MSLYKIKCYAQSIFMNFRLYKRWSIGKKILFWSVAVFIFLLILIGVGGLYLERSLPDKIRKQVHENSQGIYRLSFTKMNISLLRGNLSAKNVILGVDTMAYYQAPESKRQEALMALKAQSFELGGFKLLRYLFTKKINIESLRIDRPNILLLTLKEKEEQEDKEEDLYQRLPEIARDGHLGALIIDDLAFSSQNYLDTSQNSGFLKHISVEIEDIRLAEDALADTNRFWFAKEIRIDSDNVTYDTYDGMYQLKIQKLYASAADKELSIDSVQVIPQYPEMEFARRMVYEGDRFDLYFNKIVADGMDIRKLQDEERFVIKDLTINQANVKVFVDKSRPAIEEIAADNFPALAFRRLDLPISIDSVLLNDINIYYKEFNPDSKKAGTVFFEDVNGSLKNVSNDTVTLSKNNWIKSNLNAKFLGGPSLKVNINWNMTDPDGAFNYRGTLGGMEAQFLNTLLEPIALVRAEEGVIKGAEFTVEANRYQAQVYTLLLYEDLKVAVLNAEDGSLEKRGLLSLFVNWLAVKKSNPDKEAVPPREANLVYKHPQERSFFNLMWKALFTGFKENLGVPL